MSNTEISTHSRYTAPTHGLFSLIWPIFIDLAMHYLTVTINIYMVSMISLQAVAELNVGSQAFQLAFTLFNFVNIGVCVCCAQALGNGNKSIVRRVIHMGLGLNIVWGICIVLVCFSGAGVICKIMNIPPDIFHTSKEYLMLISFTFFAEAINLCASAILRAHGCTRDPMYVNIAGNIIIIFGNYILLFGNFGAPALGIYGVAVSTLVSRFLAVGFLYYLMVKRTNV